MATARLLFLFGTRNRACGELAGNPKNIPPLFRFISGLSGLLPSPSVSSSGPFYSAHHPLSRVFARPYMCGFISLSVSFRVRPRGKKTAACLLPRKGPFYLRAEDPSLWTSPARHANARWRDEILGGAKSRISIKAIAVPHCGSFVYRLTYIWMQKIRLIPTFNDPCGKLHWDHSINRKRENVTS